MPKLPRSLPERRVAPYASRVRVFPHTEGPAFALGLHALSHRPAATAKAIKTAFSMSLDWFEHYLALSIIEKISLSPLPSAYFARQALSSAQAVSSLAATLPLASTVVFPGASFAATDLHRLSRRGP